MKASTILVAFVCAVSLRTAVGGANEIQECMKTLGTDMSGFMQQIMSGGDTSKLKGEICPLMEKFLRCVMKATSDTRPSKEKMDELRQEVAKGTQQMKGIECDLDFDKIANEVWSAAGVARPLSILALSLTALVAVMAAKRL